MIVKSSDTVEVKREEWEEMDTSLSLINFEVDRNNGRLCQASSANDLFIQLDS